ncbi:4-hydroxybenzoate octaprenyltransferase [Phaeovibrio sulfidiphilus]|uniref:4-hydroxybenzoate octaprenyltransferase n=1 Tax=Phaeovibrio sulfidiphilus TaxID=1220600 RepID=A0A8J6YXT8_9PROT|nr:4-hydroxybenzoate octaprenyltransferase [Phaeovibrio sulfidiphilus]MBE1236563.1 4-hydroxybenzoate octaprenyltransferase [Phaeovibrio sulfidiphilus]
MKAKTIPVGVPQFGGWVISKSPSWLKPYLSIMRIDLDAGWWLLTFPAWWSLALASTGTFPNPLYMLLFLLGGILMEGAGCIFNDMVDMKFDAKVRRTAQRPLPGKLVSIPEAIVYMFVTLLMAFAILMTFNTFTVWVCMAVTPLIFVYPFMKRITYWPQAVLGVVFTWGALVGWSAEQGSLSLAPILFYLGCIFWPLHFDTLYAHQDREDDISIGVKSTALALGEKTGAVLFAFNLCFLALVAAAGATAGLGWGFWPGLALVALHFAWQHRVLDINDREVCGRLFNSNWSLGWIMLGAIVAGQLTR